MRVTERQHVDALITAIGNLRSGLSTKSEQISSGKRVNRPSDDPLAAERISQFRNILRTTERRLQTVKEGVGRLDLSDSVLEQAGNTFQRAKELAVQMRNDTNTAVERRNTAQEVQQLILGLAGIGNTQLNGRFVFAGNETHTEPFVPGTVTGSPSTTNSGSATIVVAVATPSALNPDGYEIQFTSPTQFNILNLSTNQIVAAGNPYNSGTAFSFDGVTATISNGGTPPTTGDQFFVRVGYVYQGDNAVIDLEIGDGQTVQSNIPGSQVFAGPTTDVFQDLQNFYQALVTNDVNGIETAIGQFDQSLSQVTNARTTIGANVNRLDTIRDSLELLTVNTQELRSNYEDVDFAKVASDLASLQVTLEASMATLTRQFETSLLNFIR
jgi:flagellar hook-associated protein 3 FlgL